MQHRSRNFASHPLPEGKLPHWLIQQRLQPHQLDHLVARAAVVRLRDTIDVAQQIKSLDDREVPPELRALTKHCANARDVSDAIAPRREAIDLTSPCRWLENPREYLDGSGFACAVGSDETQELAGLQREADSL